MNVVYKIDIVEKLHKVIREAKQSGMPIHHIELTRFEAECLIDQVPELQRYPGTRIGAIQYEATRHFGVPLRIAE